MSIILNQQSCLGLRSIYEGVDHPIFVIDIDSEWAYRYANFNPVAKKILGITADELPRRLLVSIWTSIRELEQASSLFR